jgi:hypothetical protein
MVTLKSNLKLRFFTSFYYVANDNKLGWYGHLGGTVYQNLLFSVSFSALCC